MRAIVICILSCQFVFAEDMNDVRVFTMTTTNVQPSYVITSEVFTRDSKTNLVRQTHTSNGVVLYRAQTFYHNGADMGRYLYNGAETIIGSTPGAPYALTYRLNPSGQIRSAMIGTIRTNDVASGSITVVTLDSFACTNGVFYPRDGSWVREINSRTTSSFSTESARGTRTIDKRFAARICRYKFPNLGVY